MGRGTLMIVAAAGLWFAGTPVDAGAPSSSTTSTSTTSSPTTTSTSTTTTSSTAPPTTSPRDRCLANSEDPYAIVPAFLFDSSANTGPNLRWGEVTVGGTDRIIGSGFTPLGTVAFWIASQPGTTELPADDIVLGETTSTDGYNGNVELTFTLPAAITEPGDYLVSAIYDGVPADCVSNTLTVLAAAPVAPPVSTQPSFTG